MPLIVCDMCFLLANFSIFIQTSGHMGKVAPYVSQARTAKGWTLSLKAEVSMPVLRVMTDFAVVSMLQTAFTGGLLSGFMAMLAFIDSLTKQSELAAQLNLIRSTEGDRPIGGLPIYDTAV